MLDDYKEGNQPGYYFAVIEKLSRIRNGWLQIGLRDHAPSAALYSAHCGDRCVWVEPGGLGGLTQFLLVVQEIARVQIDSAFHPKPVTREVVLKAGEIPQGAKAGVRYDLQYTVWVDPNGYLTPGSGLPALPRKVRVDNVGVTSELKSAISAAAKSP